MRTVLVIVALALVAGDQAYACHRFSIWKYPWAQRCRVTSADPDKSWYVEIAPLPPERDERTPEQIAESLEHDQAVAAHKDELNALLMELAK